ncbi:uncharacterized protein KY384_002726 [Bacidia gigantensis]|uniref:uncharacterized protein n=1 Tax=Bacidia gigantensis TaxID=2732470 RepID=UPI001D03EEE2|nr:uncharacterized protein KY384_002726 [Bacidia gigantensis]KAG8532848.1 hypothetical protein KY384_002726 [Bacidia gigantensis]
MAEEVGPTVAMLNRIALSPKPAKRKMGSSAIDSAPSKRPRPENRERQQSQELELYGQPQTPKDDSLGRSKDIGQANTQKQLSKSKEATTYDEIPESDQEGVMAASRAAKNNISRKQRKLGPRAKQAFAKGPFGDDLDDEVPTSFQQPKPNVQPNTSVTRSTKSPRQGRPKGSKKKSPRTSEQLKGEKRLRRSREGEMDEEQGSDAEQYHSANEAQSTPQQPNQDDTNITKDPRQIVEVNDGIQAEKEAEDDGDIEVEETQVTEEQAGATTSFAQSQAKRREKENSKMFLGQGRLWLDDIVGSIRDQVERQADDTTWTKSGRSLLNQIRRLRNLYRDGSETGDRADVERQFNERLGKLEEWASSNELPEGKIADIVRDIYVKVVPDCLILLKRTMRRRVLEPAQREAYDLQGLEEIVRIQQFIIDFCGKAISWNVKPSGGGPIIRNVKQRFFPYLKKLNSVFRTALKKEQISERRRQNAELYATQIPDPQNSEVPDATRRRREDAVHNQLLELQQGLRKEEKVVQRQAGLKRTLFPGNPPQTQTREPVVQNRDSRWTDEEDDELIDQLLNNEQTRDLPGKQRFLSDEILMMLT